MAENPLVFNGLISRSYDDYLGPFLFEPYAIDLAERMGHSNAAAVLELACGTGRLTRYLRAHLPVSTQLTATDLNPEMLALAKERVTATGITWATTDMQAIPYKDEQFDLVVSQFGLMLVPDRAQALHEIYRVLQKGGRLIYNVWANIAENEIWNIGATVVTSFLGVNPFLQDPGPFTMENETATLQLMDKAGFVHNQANPVKKTGIIEQAAIAAKGFVQGLPIYMMIRQKDPALVIKIEEALKEELIRQLGDQPMQSSLYALVYEAVK